MIPGRFTSRRGSGGGKTPSCFSNGGGPTTAPAGINMMWKTTTFTEPGLGLLGPPCRDPCTWRRAEVGQPHHTGPQPAHPLVHWWRARWIFPTWVFGSSQWSSISFSNRECLPLPCPYTWSLEQALTSFKLCSTVSTTANCSILGCSCVGFIRWVYSPFFWGCLIHWGMPGSSFWCLFVGCFEFFFSFWIKNASYILCFLTRVQFTFFSISVV